MEETAHHSKKEYPWFEICREKLEAFCNRVNHVQFAVHATTHVKPTKGSFKCYIWLSREKYSPMKLKFRIRYDADIEVMDKVLNGIYCSLKPPGYVDQADISTEVCSSSSSCASPDVFSPSDE